MAKGMADPTNDSDQSEYRKRAREIRGRAEVMSNSAIRQEMFEIAAVLERWADRRDEKLARAAKRQRPGPT